MPAGMAASTSSPTSGTHLLVPIDFSEHSRTALHKAVEMLQGIGGGRLTLLTVVEPATSGFRIQTADLHRQMEVEAERQLREWARLDAPDLPDVQVAVVAGRPADEICAQAAKRGVSTIVISTHGRTGLRHYLLGSVAESVVRHAVCPVMVVR